LSVSAGVEINPTTGGPKVNSRFETTIKGIFACGNVRKVHDLVDYVTEEGLKAGKSAAGFISGIEEGIIDPHKLGEGELENIYINKLHVETTIFQNIICTICPVGCSINITEKSSTYEVNGNKCDRGEKFALEEIKSPSRLITSTIKVNSSTYKRLPVRTDKPIPKDNIFEVIDILKKVSIEPPIKCGDVIIQDILRTGTNIISTKTIK